MKGLKISILLLTTILLLTSCGQKKKKQAELEIKKSEIENVILDYVYPLPSSFELMDMLNEIEAAFIIGVSNPSSAVENYKSKDKKALNLGVYLSDMSYTSIYNRKQEAQDYLVSCDGLVRDLNVDDAFADDFVANVFENFDNRDTLVTLVTDATQNVYEAFHRKGNKELAYLMASGAWVEAMYLTLIISENTPLNQKIINTIIFQRKSLMDIITLLDEVKDDEQIRPIRTALLGIKKVFDQEPIDALTVSQVDELTKKVNALRSIIVE